MPMNKEKEIKDIWRPEIFRKSLNGEFLYRQESS